MAPVDRRVKLWAWLVRQQGSVGTKTEAEVIAMQSRHAPANGVTNRIFGTVVPGTEVLQLFYRGQDDAVWSRWRNPDGSWSNEQSLGGVTT